MRDDGLIAFAGIALGFLMAQARQAQQAAHVPWVVAHPKMPLDQFGHPARGSTGSSASHARSGPREATAPSAFVAAGPIEAVGPGATALPRLPRRPAAPRV